MGDLRIEGFEDWRIGGLEDWRVKILFFPGLCQGMGLEGRRTRDEVRRKAEFSFHSYFVTPFAPHSVRSLPSEKEADGEAEKSWIFLCTR
jgi:hypothetical protein